MKIEFVVLPGIEQPDVLSYDLLNLAYWMFYLTLLY